MAGNQLVRLHNARPAGRVQHEEGSHPIIDTSGFVTRRGLRLPQKISFDKWVGVGRYLSAIASSSAWCLGDWLVYGEASFNGRYRDAIELTSLDYQTLRNYAWVARRFALSRRRDMLSFAHHTEVAALSEPEQDFWLRKAEDHEWSVKRLRRELKESLRERSGENDKKVGEGESGRGSTMAAIEGTVLLKVSILAAQLESCRAVANDLGLDVETWASRILLREAAHQVVAPGANG
jgi:hypothetical protein